MPASAKKAAAPSTPTKKRPPREGPDSPAKHAPVVKVRHASEGRSPGQCTPASRAVLVQLFQQVRRDNKDWSEWRCFQEVAAQKGVAPLTVQLWVRRWRKREGFDAHKHTGRPAVKMTKKNLKLFKELPEKQTINSSDEHRLLMEKKTGITFSKRCIRHMRRKTGVKTRRRKEKVGLAEVNKQKRLEIFEKLKDHDAAWWKGVAFGDNHNLYRKNWKFQVVAPGQEPQFNVHYTSDRHQLTHTWGLMGCKGQACRTALVNPPREVEEGKLTKTGKPSTALGPDTMTAKKFKEHVCEAEIWPFWKKFRNKGIHHIAVDNASVHTEGIDWLKEKGVAVLEWPASSPDMNPIEEIWDMLDQEVARKYAGKPRPGKEELVKAYQEGFLALAVSKFEKCVESMPKRIAQLIAAQGGQLKGGY
jgi:transposase